MLEQNFIYGDLEYYKLYFQIQIQINILKIIPIYMHDGTLGVQANKKKYQLPNHVWQINI